MSVWTGLSISDNFQVLDAGVPETPSRRTEGSDEKGYHRNPGFGI